MWRYAALIGIVAVATSQTAIRYSGTLENSPETSQAVEETRVAAAPKPAAKPANKPVRQQVSQPIYGKKARIKSDNRGHFIANAKLNGKKIKVLVDTGATTVAINRSTARRIGIRLKSSDFRYKVNTANGTTRAAGAMIKEVRIGKIRVKNVEAAVLEDRALDGVLLGMSFLNRLDRFSVEDGHLLLEQ